MILTLFLIFIIAFLLSSWSMRDFNVPVEIKRMIFAKKLKGTIVFFKDKVSHYRAKHS